MIVSSRNIHASQGIVLYSFDNVTMFSEPGAVHILMSD